MYITEIDNLLDKTLQKFMYAWLIDKKNSLNLLSLEKIIKEVNFFKYQKEINNIIEIGTNLISESDIKSFVTKNNNIQLIKNIIGKFISYYVFI